jgi:hypothetical protein
MINPYGIHRASLTHAPKSACGVPPQAVWEVSLLNSPSPFQHLSVLEFQLLPHIGIILCAEKDDVEVEFALRSKANPIGVAAYELQSKLPGDLKGKLPTAKQLADIVLVEMGGGK